MHRYILGTWMFGISHIWRLLLVIVLLGACKQVRKVTDIVDPPTPRERYARAFGQDSFPFAVWQKAFESALLDSLSVSLPYSEQGMYPMDGQIAYSYEIELREGQVFRVEIATDSMTAPLFMDLFRQTSDSLATYEAIAHNPGNKTFLEIKIDHSGMYRFVMQPGLSSQGRFLLKMFTKPAYAFPVAEKDPRAIQSFWGDARAGGQRSHQGVDIFASRGTPAIAATPGTIRFVGERGLGGKQVWLRAAESGNTLYYAHLDRILVERGTRVAIGDTLGLVGNTGNARTTRPHLHFGIYKGYRGAIDPLPFVKGSGLPDSEWQTDDQETNVGRISAGRANLRMGPTTGAAKIGEVIRNDTITVLGNSGQWAHIRTETGTKAFVHRSLMQPTPGTEGAP